MLVLGYKIPYYFPAGSACAFSCESSVYLKYCVKNMFRGIFKHVMQSDSTFIEVSLTADHNCRVICIVKCYSTIQDFDFLFLSSGICKPILSAIS